MVGFQFISRIFNFYLWYIKNSFEFFFALIFVSNLENTAELKQDEFFLLLKNVQKKKNELQCLFIGKMLKLENEAAKNGVGSCC